jgi:hypothetical protein
VRLSLLCLAPFTFTLFAPAAEPKPAEKKDPSRTYIESLAATAELLAKVTDEKSAADAKPKLDALFAEGRTARKEFLAMLGDERVSDADMIRVMERVPKILSEVNNKIALEFDRIAANQKAAYKVLRETKLFAEFEKALEEKAVWRANDLSLAAKSWSTRNDGKELTKLGDLANYLSEGQKGLVDPWGFPFQFKYVQDKKSGANRIVIWTQNPYTEKRIGSPKELVEEK